MRYWRSGCCFVGVAALGAALFAPQDARACSCAVYMDAQPYVDLADVVFEGTFVGDVHRGRGLESVFEVTQVWKGSIGTEQSVYGDDPPCDLNSVSSCRYTFEVGESYLVFGALYGTSCLPSTHACSGTRPSSATPEFLLQLGAGQPPEPSAVTPSGCVELECPDPEPQTPDAGSQSVDAGEQPAPTRSPPPEPPITEDTGKTTPADAGPAEPRAKRPKGDDGCSLASAPRAGGSLGPFGLVVAALAALHRLRRGAKELNVRSRLVCQFRS